MRGRHPGPDATPAPLRSEPTQSNDPGDDTSRHGTDAPLQRTGSIDPSYRFRDRFLRIECVQLTGPECRPRASNISQHWHRAFSRRQIVPCLASREPRGVSGSIFWFRGPVSCTSGPDFGLISGGGARCLRLADRNLADARLGRAKTGTRNQNTASGTPLRNLSSRIRAPRSAV